MAQLCSSLALGLALLLLFTAGVCAVDRKKFRTCAQTGFCAAFRSEVPFSSFPDPSALVLGPDGVASNQFVRLECLQTGAVRVRVTRPEKEPRWESDQVVVDASRAAFTQLTETSKFDCLGKAEVRFEPAHLRLTFSRQGETFLVLNDRGLTYVETSDQVDVVPTEAETDGETGEQREVLDWGEDGKAIYKDDQPAEPEADPEATDAPTTSRAAAESFGGFTDPKPKGPRSVGFDASFPGPGVQLFGLPEHATSFGLKDTDGNNNGYSVGGFSTVLTLH
jgi:alpha 1,3-glucosidase